MSGNQKEKKILLTGGTGFIGKELIKHLIGQGYQINILTRKPPKTKTPYISYYQWDINQSYIDLECFKGVEIIINLVGANISEKRWSHKRKLEIMESRVKSAALLYENLKKHKFPIKKLISASASGYYGAVTRKHIFTETDPAGKDFLARVCENWERSILQFEELKIKVIIFRLGVIIGNGGLFATMSNFARKGINPSLGSGKQYVPWVSLEDTASAFIFGLEKDSLEGVFNLNADEHIQMNDIAKEILNHYHKKRWTPNAPSFIIKLLFGSMSDLLLKGSRIKNDKIKSAGFNFKHSNLKEAIQAIK